MEPTNRPYVDPATEPGDAGTEPWADAPTADPSKRPPIADPVAPSDEGAAIEGSPADQFVTEDDAISARNEDPGQLADD
jgi:hypothetical protein